MSVASVPEIAFDRAESRKDYEETFAEFVAAAPRMPRPQLADAFIALEALLDDGMVEAKTVMLAEGSIPSRDARALGDWIYRQHHNLMLLGAKAVQACAKEPKVPAARTLRMLGLTLLHVGESVKWELLTGRHHPRDYPALHGLMRIALEKEWQGVRGRLVVDGMHREASVEQLYVRALLLDRFASGPLTREEIEVLDAFLWEWDEELRLDKRYPGGLAVRVDLDAAGGFVFGQRRGHGPSLYMSLEPLEARRQQIVRELHRGQVVPKHGRAASMPLEAHVAVLAQLRKVFAGVGGGDTARAPRRASLPDMMPVLVGSEAIVAFLRGGKVTPRMFEPRNGSATGYLFVVSDKAAEAVGVGTLLGLCIDPREPPVLARIVRKVHEIDDGWQIGVEMVSDPGAPIRNATLVHADGKKQILLFVPDGDRSGRFDAFVVAFGLLRDGLRYQVRTSGTLYTIAFNRVRRRGREWALAGFEILEAAAA